MSLEAMGKATEGGSTEAPLVPQRADIAISMEDVNSTKNGLDEDKIDEPKSTANTMKTVPKVHISAHERDREESSSRRVQEAQKYNNRDKAKRGGLRGRGGSQQNKSRFDPSRQEKSDDPVAIRKQVSFSPC